MLFCCLLNQQGELGMLNAQAKLRKQIASIVAGLCVAASCGVSVAKELKVYNWYDYIGRDTVANFEKETGIKVSYDVTDSWETSEAKLLSGNSGYDVVFMGSTYAARQIPAGVYLKLDKAKLPNWSGIDPYVLKMMSRFDPGNDYLQPWSWYGEEVGYNEVEFKKRFPNGADSWSVLLDPANAKKLAECGLVWTDWNEDLFIPAMLLYGKDPFSQDRKEYEEVFEKVLPIRPFITVFSNSYYNNLADGEACASPAWTGDMASMSPKPGIKLNSFIPKEGTYIDYEGLGIVADAKNVDEAYAFLNFVLKPKEAANFSNDIKYPNPVPDSKAMIDKTIMNSGHMFYPNMLPKELQDKIFPFPEKQNQSIVRLKTRLWTKFKTAM